MEKGEHSQPRREKEKAHEISDHEEEIVMYCAFSYPLTEFDEPRPEFDFSKRVVFVDPVRPMSRQTEYEEAMAAQERARARAERLRHRRVARANGDTSVKLPKVTLRRINPGIPPLKGGQLPRRFPLDP